MDSYRLWQITFIHTAKTVLSAVTYIHFLKLPLKSLHGFSATLQPDCEISSNCGKIKVSRHTRLVSNAYGCAKVWDLVIFYWFIPSMRMQVILESSFARPGSAPIWGGKKGEFRDWTSYPVEYLNPISN